MVDSRLRGGVALEVDIAAKRQRERPTAFAPSRIEDFADYLVIVIGSATGKEEDVIDRVVGGIADVELAAG